MENEAISIFLLEMKIRLRLMSNYIDEDKIGTVGRVYSDTVFEIDRFLLELPKISEKDGEKILKSIEDKLENKGLVEWSE